MGFSMEVMDTESVKKEVVEQVKPVPEEIVKLKELAENNASQIMDVDMDSLEKRKSILNSIEEFGMDSLQTSSRKNDLLQTSVVNLSKEGGESGTVANSLLDLQKEVKDLDPSMVDFTKKGLLGKIFNPMRAYFSKYQKADDVINDIIVSLEKGKTTLKNDNTALEIEEIAMRDLTKKLQKEIEMGTMMDQEISKQIEVAKSKNEDTDKVKFISEEVLFPLRQRIMDLQQMLVVNQQGIMAIEVIRRNNKELIRGVDRAINVTISAMRIAVTVASALYNQKIVLKKIQLLNETTNDLISGTSKMLKEQGAEIQKQSMEANISIDTLKTAFGDVISAMEAISTYKQEALPKMKHTIGEFRELAEKGEREIQKLERGNEISI
ncbi:toxic anion resistance protein [Natronospora cellulosivora (SeqCode)]